MPSAQPPRQAAQLMQLLAARGAMPSAAIQQALGLSQPTASRLLASMGDDLVVLGCGRSTRYALPQPVGTQASQQTLWTADEAGDTHALGTLSFLAQSQIHVQADGVDVLFVPSAQQALPWFLSPLRPQGFLGRLLAQRLSGQGVPPNPEQWDVHAVLWAALHTPDAPGALWLGDLTGIPGPEVPVFAESAPGAALDAVAADVSRTLPVGSSAGGEQPKFTAVSDKGDAWLVKFSPPRGTPFGERWNDLLVAEALCSLVLSDCGHQVAEARIVQTPARTYLLSRRFDRQGLQGRKHVVSLGAAHAGFVKTRYQDWGATADALVRQHRLTAADARMLHERLHFGRLVGNTDMHSGNASVWAAGHTLHDMVKGQFVLAPVYDMLPMRWKPDPMWGLPDYQPFELDAGGVAASVLAVAHRFWHSLSGEGRISALLRDTAAVMAARMRPHD